MGMINEGGGVNKRDRGVVGVFRIINFATMLIIRKFVNNYLFKTRIYKE